MIREGSTYRTDAWGLITVTFVTSDSIEFRTSDGQTVYMALSGSLGFL